MPLTFIESQSHVARLVKQFRTNLNHYRAPTYKEAQARQDLIDPLFEALGWDVHNRQGVAPAYKEVLVEESLDIEGHQKAADYTFRVGREPIFYVEAKRPGISIKTAPEHAYQVRRYAWNTGLPLSILTDFEELAIYEGRVRPNLSDKVSVARVNFYTYEDYPDRWRELWDVFSREAVLSGSFQQYAEAAKGKRGTSEVDAEFLKDISGWREVLARNLALRNAELTPDELNDAVQRTLDRLIFLRIAEDRSIEPYERLRQRAANQDVYAGLIDLFRAADRKYNSGLFDFSKGGDRWMLDLYLDDKVLKAIIDDLYYPNSPYRFNDIPVEILGNVYEQFLGKVIRLTAGHQAKVEEKPEVKKAGGVYYTPAYIVEYIVKQTVGQQIAGKSPKQLDGFRVLDMACGSGSFLLGAYQYLLDYYLQWYIAHSPERHTKAVRQIKGDWRLTVAEKKRILIAHIYGVDIDRQAVEVSKLSLLLKVLEGENDESLQLRLFDDGERALPNLDDNIKCGNSLIGPDYFDNQLMPDDDEMKRVNPFDWAREFPEVFTPTPALPRREKNSTGEGAATPPPVDVLFHRTGGGWEGGFDCIIGNPPYVDIKGLPAIDVEYIFSIYPSANNRINLFAAFIERALELVKPANFRFGMIVPTALLTQESYKVLRQRIGHAHQIEQIVRLPNESFGASAGDVKVDTAILVFKPLSADEVPTEIISYAGYERVYRIDPSTATVHGFVRQLTWMESADAVWSINNAESDVAILRKCEADSVPLEDCAEFCLGVTPYDKYKGHTPQQIADQVFHADRQKDKTYKKLLAGNDVMRYLVQWNGNHWISYGPWLGAPREQRFFVQRRILVKQIIDWTTKRIWATITDEELYNTQNAFNLLPKPGWSLDYILGILNSRLMTFYHRKKYLDEFKMRFQKILIKDCRRFPIRPIDFTKAADKAAHDRMVKLVDTMLHLHPRLAAAKSAHDKERIQRQIDATDQQIDALVYQLYGLTDDEIKIVEGHA